ncbi:16S rRNA (guanine(966)-N(2))-methyltransferase RsmD [Halomonas sp. McH1-25]|uniref:16S rRNA (guanine(966)-N(2))-methyltransferase RsmD n=3 Tax=Halomonas TaxID=2745 RepID=UPI001EF7101B|nr:MULTISPECIES: 16S rRNA (guanine(966)-N(2))-methyltransferase RsmD [unclassified Halomonas]MCG7601683.1 16S rRNA (guanine(966)-N(2))-methyltransferase RsmD [Halomonas sp. McH1-25]MCP1362819.1 16S rRNA (guanine(966)-N(2))-methyltransferase RsmD [Halomonas sp. BBD45]
MTRQRPSRNRRRPATSTPDRPRGKLRIIGGRFRRRLLPVADSPGLRPTPDRVRETLFNWLAFDLAGRRVLDLFAGTGALGLEALSRGADQTRFVETNAEVARLIEANLATLGATGQVVVRNALDFLNEPATPFDVVFLDPPFRRDLAGPACDLLERRGWLADDALIYVETEAGLPPQVPGCWTLHREVKAGDSHGRLYRRTPSAFGDAC